MRTMYEQDIYAELHPTWHEEDSPWKAGHIRRMIEDNHIPCTQICEIGCGVGGILLNLESCLPSTQFTGFEISPYAYNKAKARETSRTKFNLTDVTRSPVGHFDVSLIIDVFEHVENYIEFLKAVKAVGSYKIFHIPLDLSVQSLLRVSPIIGLRKSVGHIHYFFKETALETLRDCGYKVIEYRYTASRLELPNQTLLSRMLRWPRRLLFRTSPDFAVRLLGGYSLLVLAE